MSYASFRYQAKGWTKARRVAAKVEWHQGEPIPARWFHRDQPGAPCQAGGQVLQRPRQAEQHIKEGKNALRWTRLSCHAFLHNAVRLLRERREATARHERRDAQLVLPAKQERCEYCFDCLPPGRGGPYCSDACEDGAWRIPPSVVTLDDSLLRAAAASWPG